MAGIVTARYRQYVDHQGSVVELLINSLRALELGRAPRLPPGYGIVANAIFLAFQATLLTFHRIKVLQVFKVYNFFLENAGFSLEELYMTQCRM